jgi:predicted ATPase
VQARLHGRSDELAVLDRVIDALLERRTGAVVSIAGPSGIGKSRLAVAAGDRCRAIGLPVVDVTVDESFRHRPLSLFDGIPALEAADRRGSGIDVALRAVEALTARQAHAIVIDDAQWADADSLDALNTVVRRARDLAVLVVVTMRLSPVRPQLVHLRELAGLTSSDLTLGEFGADGIDAIARDRLGAAPSARLGAHLQATAGNPFLIHELLDGLIDAGRIEYTNGSADVVGGDALPADIGARVADRAVSAVPIASMVPAMAMIPSGATAGELARCWRSASMRSSERFTTASPPACSAVAASS